MYSIVCELINDSPRPPRIFSDAQKAKKHFNELVKENDAIIVENYPYMSLATAGRKRTGNDVTISIHYDIGLTS